MAPLSIPTDYHSRAERIQHRKRSLGNRKSDRASGASFSYHTEVSKLQILLWLPLPWSIFFFFFFQPLRQQYNIYFKIWKRPECWRLMGYQGTQQKPPRRRLKSLEKLHPHEKGTLFFLQTHMLRTVAKSNWFQIYCPF